MSSSVLARDVSRISRADAPAPRRYSRSRRPRAPVAQLPWNSVAIRAEDAASRLIGHIKAPPAYVWALTALAVLVHGGVVWYVSHHTAAEVTMPKHEVQLEIVRPKPPEPPKIEPPKPEPPKPRAVPKHAQVLPPIQQASPEPQTAPASVSSEPPVAVAPIVSAPVELRPEPVTPPVGRAGYLNNPPPDYPPMAARQGWEGTVTLRVHVLSTGKVDTLEVQQTSGRKILDEQALKTVKNWLFTPSKRGDTPIDGWAIVPIEFKMEQ